MIVDGILYHGAQKHSAAAKVSHKTFKSLMFARCSALEMSKLLIVLVQLGGLEPPTSCSTDGLRIASTALN
jgi:hypothetical protein